MDVTATQPTAASTATPTEVSTKSDLTSDFDTFLTMLTAQIKNQDPLNPVDSTEFASQLATFSQVEQQVQTNDLLRELAASLGGNDVSEMASWVGLGARAPVDGYFTGTPMSVRTATIDGADSASLVIRDAAGSVVQRTSISPTGGEITWAGVSDTGAPFAEGRYAFSVESFAEGQPLGATTAEVYGTVQEARLNNGEVYLVFRGGGEIAASSVTAVRNP